MTKAKTNALDALRTLIAERQQYEQWITALEARREGTPEHVFERVKGDYQSRLERVVNDIRGHSEELQLSISTLSSRLVEVAREEDTRREGLQEAELRAAVGEYEPEQWEQLRTESERALEKIAADRESLDNQLGELRAIQKLSEVSPTVSSTPSEAPASSSAPKPQASSDAPAAAAAQPSPSSTPKDTVAQQPVKPAATPSSPQQAVKVDAKPVVAPTQPPPQSSQSSQSDQSSSQRSDASPRTEPQAAKTEAAKVELKPEPSGSEPARADFAPPAAVDQGRLSLDQVAAAASAAAANTARPKSQGKTPPGGMSAIRGKSEIAKPDSSKTLKCPECGTANYPTEWYCERCGGELATM